MRAAAAALVLAAAVGGAAAQTVSLAGSLGDKALLVIDGKPQTLAVGASAGGVTLKRLEAGSALVDVGGRSQTLVLGATPVSIAGPAAPGGGSRIAFPAGTGGHFVTAGAINGQAVRFVVDTGATYVALGEADARRLGIDYRGSTRRGLTRTANGTVEAWGVTLGSVRIGDVTVNGVEAIVLPATVEPVLLGNSFLGRFRMTRDADVMVLERRY